MGAVLMGAIVLGTILLYAWFIFVWLASRLASLIWMPFRKDTDDEVVQYEGEMGLGQIVVSGTTRGDLRVRYISIFLVWPVLFYIHYLFWNELYAGFEWLFEDIVAPAVAGLL